MQCSEGQCTQDTPRAHVLRSHILPHITYTAKHPYKACIYQGFVQEVVRLANVHLLDFVRLFVLHTLN